MSQIERQWLDKYGHLPEMLGLPVMQLSTRLLMPGNTGYATTWRGLIHANPTVNQADPTFAKKELALNWMMLTRYAAHQFRRGIIQGAHGSAGGGAIGASSRPKGETQDAHQTAEESDYINTNQGRSQEQRQLPLQWHEFGCCKATSRQPGANAVRRRSLRGLNDPHALHVLITDLEKRIAATKKQPRQPKRA